MAGGVGEKKTKNKGGPRGGWPKRVYSHFTALGSPPPPPPPPPPGILRPRRHTNHHHPFTAAGSCSFLSYACFACAHQFHKPIMPRASHKQSGRGCQGGGGGGGNATRVGGLTGGFRCVWGAVSPGAVFVFVFHLGGGCPQKGRGGVHLTRDQKRSARSTHVTPASAPGGVLPGDFARSWEVTGCEAYAMSLLWSYFDVNGMHC